MILILRYFLIQLFRRKNRIGETIEEKERRKKRELEDEKKGKKKDKDKKTEKFTLYVYDWSSGSLVTSKFEFDSLDEAKTFAQTQTGTIKVYNIKGKLVHSETRNNDDNPY